MQEASTLAPSQPPSSRLRASYEQPQDQGCRTSLLHPTPNHPLPGHEQATSNVGIRAAARVPWSFLPAYTCPRSRRPSRPRISTHIICHHGNQSPQNISGFRPSRIATTCHLNRPSSRSPASTPARPLRSSLRSAPARLGQGPNSAPSRPRQGAPMVGGGLFQ